MKQISKIKYLIVCLLFIYACKGDNSKYPYSETNGLITTTYLNDTTFVVKEYYNRNSVKSIITFNNKEEKNGEYIEYYENKNLKEKGWYKSNQESGKWFVYSQNNNLIEMCEYICGDKAIAYSVSFNEDMSIDTTKVNHYSTIESMQDTIYEGEPYVFNVRLVTPYFKNGMYIVLIDSEEEYCNIRENKGFKAKFECERFEKTISIKDYKRGDNQIRGVIMNYGDNPKKVMTYYFSKNFYVKQIK